MLQNISILSMRGNAAIDITSQTYTSPELREELISPVSRQVFRPLSGLSLDMSSPQFMLPLPIVEPKRVIARKLHIESTCISENLGEHLARDHVNLTISI